MIAAEEIEEILSLYHKHGWILRRVLLSAKLDQKLGDKKDALFGEVAVTTFKIDAAWFSRPPQKGGVAWEIRHLGIPPFALLEKVDESDPDLETTLHAVQQRLHDWVTAKRL